MPSVLPPNSAQMPLGNGIVFLAGSEQDTKEDVVFVAVSVSFPISYADCQVQEVSSGS